ncbi:tRNA guanosine(34) transglycosylase Tgt [Coxiella burnetii]|uniref:tRNA guanosine(34) transglycosylase Tgt n=1 Tax=Coxiella burnetii TaxID=777 RepID=UPI0000DAEC0D|nr:tRNA guanosine(34) transglycosylase Tgt [Coxiella burnetii]ABX78030.1 queuine tRNA-ribosyltransferase [Coxiella burnetii RSA 331]ATN81898.1 tRNA-guanine(34) transglycosylase [Coxiella burnetii]ATN83800.1 tRNA-guanine(34) transglycosylase [Coxiella burnetii]POZ79251.1 tRNA-guanine(34) transglycosylase [Coxiella burnetii]
MQNTFKTEIIQRSKTNHARVTKITTPHGEVVTPAFMPVGTRAFANHLTPHDLVAAHSQIILGGNTYHMLVAPGLEVIQAAGGMHAFMGWDKPMLTDSGGFQVFSLSKNREICTFDEEGAYFKHPTTGKLIHLTPKSSIDTQKAIGADIIMAFDECTPENGGREAALGALQRTHYWLAKSKQAHLQSPCSLYGHRQALFGIIQGGSFRDLREKSAQSVVDMDLDGIAIGGEVIGFDMAKTCQIIDWVRPLLPEGKTRYAMGVGLSPQDLIDVVAAGVDIFDCVAPTRNARHGALYHGHCVVENGWVRFISEQENGRIQIKKSIYAKDETPLLAGCRCYTCQHFCRAYLHYLFKQKSTLYAQLACIHNIHVMQETCCFLRQLIVQVQ